MIKPGPDDKIYPVIKLATVIDALTAEGVAMEDALAGVRLSKSEISSPATNVSLNQIIEGCRNAARLARDPHFAYRAGARFHLAAFGMYGFAILSSMNYRQTMQFAVNYHHLATPLAEIDFTEESGYGIWTIAPMSHSRIDTALYKFLVEFQFGITISLHRDVMGSSFSARELRVSYAPPYDARTYPDVFGCPVLFGQSKNQIRFDAAWLDGTPKLGNELTYPMMVELCDRLLNDLQLRIGLTGKVRQVLMNNLMRSTSFDEVASALNMSARTLRRKLREENTSFRNLADELRMAMAIKFLRDTNLTVEDIADALGFSDAANFRHAFRRWTKAAPHEFRAMSGKAPS
jgi:AraC-like DNA-binding protein